MFADSLCILSELNDFRLKISSFLDSFKHFLNQKEKLAAKLGGTKESSQNPSQACEPEVRPSEPPCSAAEQPSPVVT